MNDGTSLHSDDKYFDYMLKKVLFSITTYQLTALKEGRCKKAALKKALAPDFKNCHLIEWDE